MSRNDGYEVIGEMESGGRRGKRDSIDMRPPMWVGWVFSVLFHVLIVAWLIFLTMWLVDLQYILDLARMGIFERPSR